MTRPSRKPKAKSCLVDAPEPERFLWGHHYEVEDPAATNDRVAVARWF